jgi:hypothetical protein
MTSCALVKFAVVTIHTIHQEGGSLIDDLKHFGFEQQENLPHFILPQIRDHIFHHA